MQQAVDREGLALEIKVALVRQALEDPDYRRLALRDPRAAVRAQQVYRRRLADAPGEDAVPRRGGDAGAALPGDSPSARGDSRRIPDNPKDVLLQKAISDRAYLDRLVADPRAVIEAEFLVEVPPGFDVAVMRETAQERIAVLSADLSPELTAGVREDLLEYQSSAWGGRRLQQVLPRVDHREPLPG